MQGRRDPDAAHSTSASHTPQQWFRQPNLLKSQRSNRSLGISSFRDLARTSRRPLASLSTNVSQPPHHTLRASTSLYGTLRDQCTPPPPPAVPELPAPSGSVLRRSNSSSVDSFTPDLSGISNISSHPTTVSPAKHHTFVENSPSLIPESMGSKVSSIARKPLSPRKQKSRPKFENPWEKEESSAASSHDRPLETKPPPATYSPRSGLAQVKVPRRRSSLTVLHLDKSHFEAADAKELVLSHRASTLAEPRERSPSTLAETIRPVTSNASTSKSLDVASARAKTLSPPLLSPTSRISSTSSQSPPINEPSPNVRNSVIGSRIHLPKTFPEGAISIRAPPLTVTHYECYQDHKSIITSTNSHCPVPCMTCGDNSVASCWKCTFCMLRICPRCMAEFAHRKKNLKSLMDWLTTIEKDEEGMKEVVADTTDEKEVVDRKENVEKQMEESALRKVEMAKKRETR